MALYDNNFYKSALRARDWQIKIGEYITDKYKIKSVIDFGCGCGFYLSGAKKKGATVKGYEPFLEYATPYVDPDVLQYIWNYPCDQTILSTPSELVISVEVGEHIKEEDSDTYVQNLTSASSKIILFSSSPPRANTDKSLHINEQPRDFWINKFKKNGFTLDQKATKDLQDTIWRWRIGSRYLKFLRTELCVYVKDGVTIGGCMTCRERAQKMREDIKKQKEELSRKDPKTWTYNQKRMMWGEPKSRIVNGKQENYFAEEEV